MFQVDGPSAAARHELDDGEDSERRLALALAKELVSTIEASPEPHAALDLVDKVRRALLAIPDEPPARVEGKFDGADDRLNAAIHYLTSTSSEDIADLALSLRRRCVTRIQRIYSQNDDLMIIDEFELFVQFL